MHHLAQRLSNSGARPLRGRYAMLEGARMTLGKRNAYAIFLDNDPMYSEWGREMFSLS